jgi:pyridoxamine 5'-phosphate oxidase
MNLQDCIKFAAENPACFVATAEGDQPRVRTFLMWFADETGFYFATLSPKQVSKQLKANDKVEVCFFNHAQDMMAARQLRVTGTMERLNDEALVKKIAAERAGLEQVAGQPLGPLTEVFRISSGVAHFWTMMDVLKEPSLERIRF